MTAALPTTGAGARASLLQDVQKFIDTWVWGSRLTKSGAAGRTLVIVLRYLYAMLRDFFSGQLTMRAMSLVYTTLLSIVPLLAVSFAILKGFGVFNQLEPYLENALAPLGAQGEQITDQALALVDNVRGPVLGGVGLAIFLWTAISTVQKVEESFNYVWYVSKPRSFTRRFTEYLIVLLVGPLLMVTAIGLLTSLQSTTVVQFILNNEVLGPGVVVVGKLMPYVLVCGVFTFLYMYMPNTDVRFVPALVGGVAGGILWATVSAIFTTFVLFASRRMEIYAGFAVAITALIWLYLNWLILLIGAQLAFYHQRPAFMRTGRQEPRLSNAMRERIALNVMFLVGRAFRRGGDKITANDLSQRMNIPSIALDPIIDALEADGLILCTEDENLLPGREMARMKLEDIVVVVREKGETGSHREPRWAPLVDDLGNRFDEAISGILGDRTLANLLDDLDEKEVATP